MSSETINTPKEPAKDIKKTAELENIDAKPTKNEQAIEIVQTAKVKQKAIQKNLIENKHLQFNMHREIDQKR